MLFLPSKSSCSYTAAGGSLHVTAPRASLEQAEKLEGGNVKEAFAIYESLVGESPEAGYRCGLMLLEGRGTTRNLWQAYKCLKWAAGQGHSEASEVLSKIEKKMYWLGEIVIRLSEAVTYIDGTLEISPWQQPAVHYRMRMLILSDKNEINAENSIITYHDITEAIDDINSHPTWQDGPGNAALQDCLKKVAESFPLTKEDATEVAPFIMTRQQQLVLVEKMMGHKERAGKEDTEKWTITCHDINHFVFDNGKRRCLTPAWLNDEQAETYRQRLIGSLLAEGIEEYNQQARKQGEQACVGMVIQAPWLLRDVLGYLDQFLPIGPHRRLSETSHQFHQDIKKLQNEAWWLDKLQPGAMASRQVKPSSWNFFDWLINLSKSEPTAKTFCLENPDQRKVCNLPGDETGKNYLYGQGICHPALLKRIENGQLSLMDATAIKLAISSWCRIISHPETNESLEDGFYNCMLTPEQFRAGLGLSRVQEALGDPAVQQWLKKPENLLYFPLLLDVKNYFALAVRSEWVRDSISSGRLPVKFLSRLTEAGVKALCDPGLQTWLEEAENLSFLPYIFDSDNFAWGVHFGLVRDGLTLKLITPDQLTPLTPIRKKVLEDYKVQHWLARSGNTAYLPFILGSNTFAWCVHFELVRDGLTLKLITPDQLAPLTPIRREALGDHRLRCWLAIPENSAYLPLLLGSDNFAWAVRDVWMRDNLTCKLITPDQLTQLTPIRKGALEDGQLWYWLRSPENSAYLPFLLGSDNFAWAVRDRWMRDGLTLKLITPDQLTQLTPIRKGVLEDDKLQYWLRRPENSAYLPLLILGSDTFAWAVRAECVRDGLKFNLITPDQLTQLTPIRKEALEDDEVLRWLTRDDEWWTRHGENLAYLPFLLDSDTFAKAVRAECVRDGLTLKLITPDQLTQLTPIRKEALEDDEVQRWLARDDEVRRRWPGHGNNLAYLPLILGSDTFARAVCVEWVRDGLTSKRFTDAEVTQLTFSELNVLLERRILQT